jgi:hypothetical protein
MRRVPLGLAASILIVSAAMCFAGQVQPPSPNEGKTPSNILDREVADQPPQPQVVAGPVDPQQPVEAVDGVIVIPRRQTLPESEAAGLSKATHPEILTWDRIYALALVRARTHRGAFVPLLDPAALAEEAARLGVADFARFRTNFHSNGPFRDPGPSVLELYSRLLAIDNALQNVAFHENLHKLIADRSKGATAGTSQLDVDTIFAALLKARQKLADEIRQFRDGLDEVKFQLGLSPRAPVIFDTQNLKAFEAVFASVEEWKRRSTRRPGDLPEIIERFPAPGEVIVNGAPILDRIEKNPDLWEQVFAEAAQLALKSRSERDEVPTQPNSGVGVEVRIRRRIRSLFEQRRAYQAEKQRYEQAIRVGDQAFERLVSPPPPVPSSRSSLVKDVLEQQSQVTEIENRLATLWTSFRADRLALYHDLGVLPYNDWKSLFADLVAVPAVAAPSGPAAHPRPTAGDPLQPLPQPGPGR